MLFSFQYILHSVLECLGQECTFQTVLKNKFSFLERNVYKKPLRVKFWRIDMKERAKIHFL